MNSFMHWYFSISNWVNSWRASICFHLRCVTIQTLASLLMLPLKRPSAWIIDLVTWLSVCQQLHCTIVEFHAGCLHKGWVKQQSEWGLGKDSTDRQCCGTSQNNVFVCPLLGAHVLVAEVTASAADAHSWLRQLCCRLFLPVCWTEELC